MQRIFIGVLLSLFCLAGVTSAQSLKIGYVDLQRALNESTAGQTAKERFKAEVGRMEQSLELRQNEVEKLKNELEKKALLLRDEERDTLERDYRQKLRDFERLYKDSQQELE